MLIYTPIITNRINYIFQLIFETVWKIDYEISDNLDYFTCYDGPKLNYSNSQLADECHIKCQGILTEKGISDQEIIFKEWNKLPIFFQINDSFIPFDIFSASFYLVSRYEEYLPHIKDHYNRFTAKQSLAYQNNFLHRPLINLWLKEFKKKLLIIFPSLNFPKLKFTYQSTIDVDNAYYYLEKGFVRNTASFIKSALEMDKLAILERREVLLGNLSDPYDTFDYQLKLNEKYNIDTLYFILLADYGINDKNCSVYSRKFQLLIKHLSDHSKVGIHPSFASNQKFDILSKEKNRLENILKKEVKYSRQHFLKLELPKTYRNLIELGVSEDYTMGYAANLGFRASICTPFYFYDLEIENTTILKINPFAVMDATCNYYLKLTPNQSLAEIKAIINQVKSVDGHFISLWHNETWSNYKEWKGWHNLYEEMLQYINL